jgi:hypothetical protein
MEMVQECAGNLLAELYDARFEFEHGRMSQQAYLSRVEVLRARGRCVRERHCKPRSKPRPAAMLPGFENYAEGWRLLLETATRKESDGQPNPERHEVWAASYL